jgi:hypothetical protein
MANESAITGPLTGYCGVVATMAALEAVRKSLDAEVGGFDVETVAAKAAAAAVALLNAASPGVLNAVVSAMDERYSSRVRTVRQTTASHSVGLAEDCIEVEYTATGAAAVVLPTAALALPGLIKIVKDSGATAGTNNITVSTEGAEKIDGADTSVISTNSATRRFMVNAAGAGWLVI